MDPKIWSHLPVLGFKFVPCGQVALTSFWQTFKVSFQTWPTGHFWQTPS